MKMSGSLLKAEDAASHGHDGASSRGGFYGLIDRVYMATLGFAMRHRLSIAVLALAVIFSSVPLYGMVKQDYLPSDVDESEFDVNVNAREGTSLAAMDGAMRAVESELMRSEERRV